MSYDDSSVTGAVLDSNKLVCTSQIHSFSRITIAWLAWRSNDWISLNPSSKILSLKLLRINQELTINFVFYLMSYVMTVTLTPTRVLLIVVLDTSSVSFLALHVSSVKDGVEHEYYVRLLQICSACIYQHLSLIITVSGCCSMVGVKTGITETRVD